MAGTNPKTCGVRWNGIFQRLCENVGARVRTVSTLGFWLSPFGGYGQPKGRSHHHGKGPRIRDWTEKGFSLAGPNITPAFSRPARSSSTWTARTFFKFDGFGPQRQRDRSDVAVDPGLAGEEADLSISITTGTWHFPILALVWGLTWRGGGDMGFHGLDPKTRAMDDLSRHGDL